MMQRLCIVGTGLIGASVGLAFKEAGFRGEVLGFDVKASEAEAAKQLGAIDAVLATREDVLCCGADVFVLATPVLPIMDWIERLAVFVGAGTLITDVGSTKREIRSLAKKLFNASGHAAFLPGHPMAGKEQGGAALAEATLFRGATWLFTPLQETASPQEVEWRGWVARMGAVARDMDAEAHDEVCAWVSHLPQFLSTALSALLEDTFAGDPSRLEQVRAIGGRALRETTRLGASPYSMWRDVALTNTENIAAALLALEQRLAHLRENLKTPELREEFAAANKFRR